MIIRFAEWLSPTANEGQFPSLAARKFSFLFKSDKFFEDSKETFSQKSFFSGARGRASQMRSKPTAPPQAVWNE
jgi:hypothetical protein